MYLYLDTYIQIYMHTLYTSKSNRATKIKGDVFSHGKRRFCHWLNWKKNPQKTTGNSYPWLEVLSGLLVQYEDTLGLIGGDAVSLVSWKDAKFDLKIVLNQRTVWNTQNVIPLSQQAHNAEYLPYLVIRMEIAHRLCFKGLSSLQKKQGTLFRRQIPNPKQPTQLTPNWANQISPLDVFNPSHSMLSIWLWQLAAHPET